MPGFKSFLPGLLLGLLAPGVAAAEEAPAPIELGQFYLTVGATYEQTNTPDFSAIGLYKDDTVVTGADKITLVDAQGKQLHYETDSRQLVPDLAVGFGLMPFDFSEHESQPRLIRLELGGRAWRRDIDGFIADSTLPIGGVFVNDDDGNPVETNLFSNLGPIDGDIEDGMGNSIGLLTNFPIVDADFDLEEVGFSGELMGYIDGHFGDGGQWLATQGVGISFAQLSQDTRHRFELHPDFLLIPGVAASTGGDISYTYDYELVSRSFGFPISFTFGRLLMSWITVFVKGDFAPQYTWASLDGSQDGLCFSTCDLSGATVDVSRGRINLDKTKGFFTFDTSGRLGVSLRLWRARVTTTAGVRYDTSWLRPDEMGSGQGITVRKGGTFGYFGKAGVSFAFN